MLHRGIHGESNSNLKLNFVYKHKTRQMWIDEKHACPSSIYHKTKQKINKQVKEKKAVKQKQKQATSHIRNREQFARFKGIPKFLYNAVGSQEFLPPSPNWGTMLREGTPMMALIDLFLVHFRILKNVFNFLSWKKIQISV